MTDRQKAVLLKIAAEMVRGDGMSKQKQTEVVTYSDEDRQRYLFRTAEEMRAINEKAEARTAKYAGVANAGTDVDETAVIR